MNRVTIENWTKYGDYLTFSNLVDKTGEWIMLEVTGDKIIGVGKKISIQKFTSLLSENNIDFYSDL